VITNIIVWTSAVTCVAFVLAWILRPDLRAWIERPKYQFLADVERYDRGQPAREGEKGSQA
jgi:hypothetical protein